MYEGARRLIEIFCNLLCDERYGRITCMMDDVEGRRERP